MRPGTGGHEVTKLGTRAGEPVGELVLEEDQGAEGVAAVSDASGLGDQPLANTSSDTGPV